MAERVQEFPLFPLELVALPYEHVRLHIFEERYKTMITACVEGESEFGVLWLAEEGLKDTGCALVVEEVLERFEDGRLLIACRGTRPFLVVEHEDHLPYPAGTIEWLEDKDEDADEGTLRSAREAYAELVEEATDEPGDPDQINSMGAYAMAATVDFGLDAKQGLLDLRSENARLRLVARLFRAAVRRLDFIERAQARARSNGKVRFE
jgi:Lon protease-like protein